MSATRKRTPYVKVWWTTAQEAYLRDHYPSTPMPQMMAELGRAATAIQSRAKALGVRRSAAFIAGEHGGRMRSGDPRGLTTRFQRKAVVA